MEISTPMSVALNNVRCRRTSRGLWKGLFAMTMLLLMTGSSWASHYAGAEFKIEWITGESYRITEKVYRDCQGIALGTTASASLVNLGTGTTQVLTLNRTALNDITPLCPGQVSPCPSSLV